jgi:hypothetical protein
MPEEKANRETPRDNSGSNAGSANRPGRKGRRRYFQPKKDGKSQSFGGQGSGQSAGQAANQGSQSQRAEENNRRGPGKRSEGKRSDDEGKRGPGRRSDEARKARRRARSRQRYDDNRAANLEAEVAYVAPQSVYIYEHSVHPELRDSYEFRPDHFSKVGRTLADYQLDLSKLFPGDIADDGTPVLTNMLPKPQYDWTGWEEAEAAGTTAGETEQKG